MSELTNTDKNGATARTRPAVDAEHTGAEAARPRLRVWQLLVFVAGVVVMAGALAFVATSSSAHDEAMASQRRAEHVIAVHRLARQDAKQKFDAQRVKAGVTSRSAHVELPMLQSVLRISDEEVTESQTMQRLGADPSIAWPDYIASTKRYDALVDQYRAELNALITAQNSTPPPTAPATTPSTNSA